MGARAPSHGNRSTAPENVEKRGNPRIRAQLTRLPDSRYRVGLSEQREPYARGHEQVGLTAAEDGTVTPEQGRDACDIARSCDSHGGNRESLT